MGGWRKPSIVEPDVLRLHEVIVLRRLRNGDTQAEAARALGWSTNKVNCLVSYVRRRFGADSPQELLDLPRVIEQLEEDGGS
jgi:DNA-binding CsgD family transcriptional regulator